MASAGGRAALTSPGDVSLRRSALGALADTTAINRFIEAQIRLHPAQYLWVHKRFKTRPAGEAGLY